MKVFRDHEHSISTEDLEKGLTSNQVLAVLRDDLLDLGFAVEGGERSGSKITRPVFFGDNGIPTLRYQVDGYQEDWECGLEVEAGRAWMGLPARPEAETRGLKRQPFRGGPILRTDRGNTSGCQQDLARRGFLCQVATWISPLSSRRLVPAVPHESPD